MSIEIYNVKCEITVPKNLQDKGLETNINDILENIKYLVQEMGANIKMDGVMTNE